MALRASKAVYFTFLDAAAMFTLKVGVLHGSVVKRLTRNLRVLGSSHTGFFEFFAGVSFGKTLQSPRLALVKPRKDTNNVNCHWDITEILLKAA